MAAEVPFGPKQNFVMNSGMADLGQWNGKVTYRITAWLAGLENEWLVSWDSELLIKPEQNEGYQAGSWKVG